MKATGVSLQWEQDVRRQLKDPHVAKHIAGYHVPLKEQVQRVTQEILHCMNLSGAKSPPAPLCLSDSECFRPL